MTHPSAPMPAFAPEPMHRLLNLSGYSLEMTARQIDALTQAQALAAAGTPLFLAFLPQETQAARLQAVGRARTLGFEPVPHLAARRLDSEATLCAYLAGLRAQAAVRQVFVVAGDPPRPAGPYANALALIRSGLLNEYGIERVSITAYPAGHPHIDQAQCWQALHDKSRLLAEMGLQSEIVTQFGFQAEPILTWLETLRGQGVDTPVRLGIAGPVSVHKLLRYAAACGVGASAGMLRHYGASLTRLFDTAGPERLLNTLGARLNPLKHGNVLLHFFPFGDLEATLRWLHARPSTAPAAIDVSSPCSPRP